MWRALADLVVAVHAAYVVFVVFGLAAILLGYFAGWRWVRNLYFRLAHLAAILAVCAEALLGWTCPLTTLENLLRERAGEAACAGDFIGRWLDWLIFYNAPTWVFTTIYLAFGALVLATLWLVPPHRSNPSAHDTRWRTEPPAP
jgi:hypothetical protein